MPNWLDLFSVILCCSCQKRFMWLLLTYFFFIDSFPVTQLCVSSYRAITYYQSSGRMRHKMQGMLSLPTAWKDTHAHTDRNRYKFTYVRTSSACFLSWPLPDRFAATGCTVKVRPLDSHHSSPSSQHQTTWTFTTTKVRKRLWSFYSCLSFGLLFYFEVLSFICSCICVVSFDRNWPEWF